MRECPQCKSKRIFYTDTLYVTAIRVYSFDELGRIDEESKETVEIKEYIGCKFIKCSDCDWTIQVK